jgi:hypothetical protein
MLRREAAGQERSWEVLTGKNWYGRRQMVALSAVVRTTSRVLGRRKWQGLEMLPVRGLRVVGAPACHAGEGGGLGLRRGGTRLGAAVAP